MKQLLCWLQSIPEIRRRGVLKNLKNVRPTCRRASLARPDEQQMGGAVRSGISRWSAAAIARQTRHYKYIID